MSRPAHTSLPFARAGQWLVLIVSVGLLLLVGHGWEETPAATANPLWAEDRFQTGCDPGPYKPYERGDPRPVPPVIPTDPSAAMTLSVDLASADQHQPILGSGFNFEHGLWSCEPFHSVFQNQILAPFQPSIARVDTGLLPAAPPELSAWELGPEVYRSVLQSAPYQNDWGMFHLLNQDDVRVILGVWGGPDQFTLDGTRRGQLAPWHYDDYVDYVVSLVDYLVREQGISVWAITVANEPDGGDGNSIPPAGYAYIAHQLATRLEPYNVKLYGPDTTGSLTALDYLPLMFDDQTIVDHMAFVGFHEYNASPAVGTVVDWVHATHPELPVIVTEYTSFSYGDLDAGQEATDPVGFTLDIVNTVLSHYQNGADAALYWDAVDYLQPGHDALTRWGLLRGPQRGFRQRLRYSGLEQVLPYLQPGARVLDIAQNGGEDVSTLAVRTVDGGWAVFLDNIGPTDQVLTLRVAGPTSSQTAAPDVVRTDATTRAQYLGRLLLVGGEGQLTLPRQSITTISLPPQTADPSSAALQPS